MFKKTKYKDYEIHFTNGQWKYDVYKEGKWLYSTNSLKQIFYKIGLLRIKE